MRVLFVSPNTERLNMPTLPLGLALVAGCAATDEVLQLPSTATFNSESETAFIVLSPG
jgi:hypothetical protein